MEQVVPGSIVYSDLKPEAILNDVRLIKYYPTSNVNGQLPEDLVRFELRGNGFFDPFSAYVYFEIEIPVLAGDQSDTVIGAITGKFLDDSAHSLIQRLVIRSEGTEIERLENYDVLAKMLNDVTYTDELRAAHHGSGMGIGSLTANTQPDQMIGLFGNNKHAGNIQTIKNDTGLIFKDGGTTSGSISTGGALGTGVGVIVGGNSLAPTVDGAVAGVPGNYGGSTVVQTLKYAIPLYSGVLGVLMPEKKMLPLSYMPLEVEFTLNPYAFYCYGAGFDTRTYTVKKMEIHSHIVTFEHEVSQQMDAVVARQGLYIPFESFFQSATSVHSEGSAATSVTIPVNAHFKSITSLHMLMIPSGYESSVFQKKLQFVSGNVTSLQVRNGINYLPSLPITGAIGDLYKNDHLLFYNEMLKSWNRLHDHSTPVPILPQNFCINEFMRYNNTPASSTFVNLLAAQLRHPKCQLGISFLGEELGKDQSTITGKRGLTPFDIEVTYQKPVQKELSTPNVISTTYATSLYFIPYVRADFLIYIRPDLVVQILGK